MLLAIDVGNTHSVFGLWDGSNWRHVWRRHTDAIETEDQLAVWLRGLMDLSDIDEVICASVVPGLNTSIRLLAERWLDAGIQFLSGDMALGVVLRYEPVNSLGADRLANVLGALAKYQPPLLIVDFGTATKLEVVGPDGAYEGGAILPGIQISSQALFGGTAKLPAVSLEAPRRAIGKNTTEAIQSGVVLGYAAAIDGLATKIIEEIGAKPKVIATGGQSKVLEGLCQSIEFYEPYLTLDGLRVASDRLRVLPSN